MNLQLKRGATSPTPPSECSGRKAGQQPRQSLSGLAAAEGFDQRVDELLAFERLFEHLKAVVDRELHVVWTAGHHDERQSHLFREKRERTAGFAWHCRVKDNRIYGIIAL